MQPFGWIIAGLIAVAAVVALVFWRRKESELDQAIRLFRLRRETLEAKFFDIAASLGKPRDLRWTRCDWKDEVRFARDLETGLLTAFAGVEIHFEAVEGGDMEDVDAVEYFREASAIFHYRNGVWGTGGKAMFNMGPADAVERLAGQFEPILSSPDAR